MRKIVALIVVFGMFTILGTARSFAGLSDGLVAYYPFNGNANDESGNGNNGTVHGATLTQDRFGNAHSAYSFDGISNYIDITNNLNFDFGNKDFSISFWFNASGHGVFVTQGDNLNNRWYAEIIQSVITYKWWNNGVLELNLVGNTILTDDVWYHYVIVREGNKFNLYLNGNLESSVTHSVTFPSYNKVLGIGSDVMLGGWTFVDGSVDDIRIYNRALSESEIQELYEDSTSGGLAGSAWPCFMYDAHHTGQSPYIGAQTNTIKWTFETNTLGGTGSPAIGTDGTIYFGSGRDEKLDGFFYALNPDGSLKWSFLHHLGCISWTAPAISANGTIYFGSRDSYLYALNPDGSLKWKYQLTGEIRSSPVINNDGIVYVCSLGRLYAFNPDGNLRWIYSTPFGGAISSSPAIGNDGTIYFEAMDCYIYAINKDGTLKWRYNLLDSCAEGASPAIGTDGTIYIAAPAGLFALNPSDGSLKWHYSAGDYITATPGIGVDGRIYFSCWDSYFYALNPDGSLKWRYQTGGWDYPHDSPAISADGTIYFANGDSGLYAFNPDGSVKWHQTGNYHTPAIGADGTIYTGTDSGILYAFGAKRTLIELDQFNAVPKDNQITAVWNTLSEIDNAGFNLWRSDTKDGKYIKINSKIIEAEGGATQKAEYAYGDDTAKPGATYYYKLEDIDTRGASTFHDPVSAVIPRKPRKAAVDYYPQYWYGMYSEPAWPPVYGMNYSWWPYYPYP